MTRFVVLRPGVVATATAALTVGLLSGCAGEEREKADSASAQTSRVVTAQPYKIDSSLPSALGFFRNINVFEGTVTAVLPDLHAVDKLDTGQNFEAVYTPVTIRIDSVYRGDLRTGSEVTVRSMGGEAEGLRYVIHDAPAKETFRPGTRVVVFGAELGTVDSESTPAITPNFVYQLTGTQFVDATYADGPANGKAPSRVDVADMRAKLERMPPVPARG